MTRPPILHGSLTEQQINAFLARPLLARLATAVPSRANPQYHQPHVVPVWYHWDGSSLRISAFQSTRKVIEARRNPLISVIIDLEEPIDGVKAVLMEGPCTVIVDPAVVQPYSRAIYIHYMGEEGAQAADPQSWVVDPDNAIIQLTPRHIYTW